ncbi:hypothetical protein [Yinghuangia sp. YIM S09857]|uniref:hypothetical protein n=1 Tax=Yinghuangia sp. YIM S09857 TaxID=3436929 RepID=UPI003F5356A6
MAATTTIAVSVPVDLAEAVRAAAGGNVSAFAVKAFREAVMRDSLAKLHAAGYTGPGEDLQEFADEATDR